jgi:hypothetical protein
LQTKVLLLLAPQKCNAFVSELLQNIQLKYASLEAIATFVFKNN